MAVNRFDQPSQAQFLNTYVPIPFEELAQAAQMRQGRHDENVARVDAARSAIDNLVAIPNSADEQYVDEVRTKLDNLATEYSGHDLSDSEVYRELKGKLRTIADPNALNKIQQTYAGWQGHKQMEAQMQAKGQKVYDPKDFTGYDSFNDGVYTGLPTMDLGAQAEDAINKFLTKPEQKYREVPLPSGRIGIEHYRDINEIESLIDSEGGELVNNPAIQQLMEREGLDEEGFKQMLKDRAPSHVATKLSSVSSLPTKTGSGLGSFNFNSFNRNSNTLDQAEEIKNVDKRDLEEELYANEKIINDPDVPEFLKNQAINRNAVLEDNLNKARSWAEKKYGDIAKEGIEEAKESVADLNFLKRDPDLSDTVVNLFDKYLNANKGGGLEFVGTMAGEPQSAYSGETGLEEELKELGVSWNKRDRILKQYRKFFKDNRDATSKYRKAEQEFLDERESMARSDVRTTQHQYKYSTGQVQYENIFNEGETEPSEIHTIALDIAKDPEDYERYMDDKSTRPGKTKKLFEKIKENELVPANYTVSHAFKESNDPNTPKGIKLNMGVYPKDASGNPVLNELKDDIDVIVRDADLKNNIVGELYKRGDFTSAYRTSKLASDIDDAITYRTPNEPVVIPLVGDSKLSVIQDGSDFTIRHINNSEIIEEYTVTGEAKVKEAVHNAVDLTMEKEGEKMGLPYFPIHQMPRDSNLFLW